MISKSGFRRTATVATACLAVTAASLSGAAAAGPNFVFPTTSDAGGSVPASQAGVSLVIGDFDGDGRSDVVVPVVNREGVSVLLNQGGGKLGSPLITPLPQAASVFTASTADLDADGRLDLVAGTLGDAGPATRILLGRGDGTFAVGQRIVPDGTAVTQTAVADVDGDGAADIASLVDSNTTGSNITVALGNGDGTFATPTTYLPPYQLGPADLDLVDVNGDAAPDLVYLQGCVVVRLNDGAGGFGPQLCSSDSEGRLTGVAQVVADFNNDTYPDIATADGSGGHVTVALGDGEGKFAFLERYSNLGNQADWITAADFTGDGELDLVAAADASPSPPSAVSVLLSGTGDGTFEETARFQTGGSGVAPIRLDADSDVDLVAAGLGGGVATSRNAGGGEMQAPRVYAAQPGAAVSTIVEVADVDGDGKRDAVTAQAGLLNVRLAVGGGRLGDVQSSEASDQILSLALTDVNTDGRLDAVVGSFAPGNIQVLLGAGDGTFAPSTDYRNGSGAAVLGVNVGDVTGDGVPDIVTNASASLSTMRGLGDGTFAPAILSGVGAGDQRATLLADFTGDGLLDAVGVVVTGTPDNASSTMYLNRGRGDGAFAYKRSITVDTNASEAAATDLVGGPRPDVAVVGLKGTHTGRTGLFVVPLGPKGVFEKTGYYSGPGFGLATADLGGGRPTDVATVGPGALRTFRGTAKGTLVPSRRFPAGKNAVDVAAGDLGGGRLPEMVELDATNPEQLVVYGRPRAGNQSGLGTLVDNS